jgi:enoyl-CoA hydratase/carnithine racemase
VGHEAIEWGVVNYVVPDDELEAGTMVIAREVAEGDPIALRLTPRTVHHAAAASLRDHLAYEVMEEGISAADRGHEGGSRRSE